MLTLTAEECRVLRGQAGLSTEALARAAGLAHRTVLRFEAGLVSARPGTVIALRRALRSASGTAAA